ncbi:hypothetical protein K9L97_02010 [Candidatus Woesearchaeota archaeon]|nr:hypothetical protein [Candidatus Woesearchaeota archaeon]
MIENAIKSVLNDVNALVLVDISDGFGYCRDKHSTNMYFLQELSNVADELNIKIYSNNRRSHPVNYKDTVNMLRVSKNWVNIEDHNFEKNWRVD